MLFRSLADDAAERGQRRALRKRELDAHVEAERQPPLVGDPDAAATDVQRGRLAADRLVDAPHGDLEVRRDADVLAALDALDVAAEGDRQRPGVLRAKHAAEAVDAAAG